MTNEQTPLQPPAAPRRSLVPMALVALACLALGSGATFWLSGRAGHDHEQAAAAPPAAAKPQYVCPMHPTVVSDHPSDCPICGMKLVKTAAAGGAAEAKPAAAAKPQYVCPMHPTVVSGPPERLPDLRHEAGEDGRGAAARRRRRGPRPARSSTSAPCTRPSRRTTRPTARSAA